MTDETMPTLADDEDKLGQYATQLADQVESVTHSWLVGLVAARAPGIEQSDPAARELMLAAQTTVSDVRALLLTDIADQRIGPLEVLRRAIQVPTAILAAAGAAVAQRDEFSRTNFPDDVYDLTPASFAAVDSSLHEPGLMWGAAKAHVHLRRRRDAAPQ